MRIRFLTRGGDARAQEEKGQAVEKVWPLREALEHRRRAPRARALDREFDRWHRIKRAVASAIAQGKEEPTLGDKDTATKADVAKVADDLNGFMGNTDKAFASVWKALDKLAQKRPAAAPVGTANDAAATHEHVPPGHDTTSPARITGPIATEPEPRPVEETAPA